MKKVFFFNIKWAIVRMVKNGVKNFFAFPKAHLVPVSSTRYFSPRGSEYQINFLNEITSVGDLQAILFRGNNLVPLSRCDLAVLHRQE